MPARLVAAFACAVGCFAMAGSPEDSARPDRIGQRIDALRAIALDGATTALRLAPGQSALIVAFLSFDCPVSNSYIEPLKVLAKRHGGRVGLIGVIPGDEPPDEIKRRLAEYKIDFPIYRDPNGATTAALKATITPEVFVFDADMRLRYRGRIDDGFSGRMKRNPRQERNDLRDALDDVLAGREVRTPVTEAVGCKITEPVRRAADGAVTYHRDVAPILQKHCQGCHRPGEVGPFALLTYKQAVRWADDIKSYTQSRQMPPWMPHGGPGYKNERRLSDADIATLARWVDAGAPEGSPADAPPPVQYVEGWQRGVPDLILSPSEPFHLGATGRDIFRCFVLPTGLTEDKWVVGFELRPGNPRIVHHTLHFFDATGKARELEAREREKGRDPDAADYGPGYSVAMGVGFVPSPSVGVEGIRRFGGMGGWAPGQQPNFLPEGCGWLLPKGADLIIQTHYHRDGRENDDRTQIGLYFAKKPIQQPWQTVTVNGMRGLTVIPAGKPDFVSRGTVWLTGDCLIHSVMPHMHLIGKKVKVTMTPPGGEPQTLVEIPNWDYNWQETYWFKEPIPARAGTKLEVEAVYDNSSANPNNPRNPPAPVFVGEQTTNEMLFAFLGVTSTKTPPERVRGRATPPTADSARSAPGR